MLRASIAAGSGANARAASQAGESLYLCYLQDAVAYLFGKHELRVGGDAHQHLVEFQIAALARLQDTQRSRSRSMKFSNNERSKNSGELNP